MSKESGPDNSRNTCFLACVKALPRKAASTMQCPCTGCRIDESSMALQMETVRLMSHSMRLWDGWSCHLTRVIASSWRCTARVHREATRNPAILTITLMASGPQGDVITIYNYVRCVRDKAGRKLKRLPFWCRKNANVNFLHIHLSQ